MSDLGDISNFLKEGGLANLDYLDVNERDYEAMDRLPKQNLDILPDLEAQWAHQDKSPSAYFVPNVDLTGKPQEAKTMADLSDVHGPIRTGEPDPIVRLARLAIMRSTSLKDWKETLQSKFASNEITARKTALSGVLAERGLLGRLYIEASDFPGCGNTNTKTASEFVRKFAGDALFVRTKEACGDCVQNMNGRCGVFHKQLVDEIPYSEALAQSVERNQQAKGFVASKTASDPKERIRTAYLNKSEGAVQYSGQRNTGAIIPAERLLRKGSDVAAQEEQLRKAKAEPIVASIRRELLKGRSTEEVVQGLRLAFEVRDLQATQQYWAPLMKEAGLYGTIYSTQDSFSDCREGADFLAKHGSKVRAIVAGSKCGSCIFSKAASCMMYGRKLVASAEDVYTPETVRAVLDEHKMAGTMSPVVASSQDWGATPREALVNIHKTASTQPATQRVAQPRMNVMQAYYGGGPTDKVASDITKREIVKTAAKYLNEGLYGSDLKRALQNQFDPRDLVAAKDELRSVLAEQGLQGIFFVDPSVYEDYGKGCHTAQRKHRSASAVKYAKVGDKCGSCVHQTVPGTCSVLAKQLVHEPPYLDKAAQQRAVLASGTSQQIDVTSVVSSGLTMMQEFELTGGTGNIDLNPTGTTLTASIEFGSNSVDLGKL